MPEQEGAQPAGAAGPRVRVPHAAPRPPPCPQEPASLGALREEVEDFAKQFPTIGFEKGSMRYKE
jgi:hypothetical protein